MTTPRRHTDIIRDKNVYVYVRVYCVDMCVCVVYGCARLRAHACVNTDVCMSELVIA